MQGDDVTAIDPELLVLRPFVADDDAEVTSWFPDAGALRFFAGRRLTWPLDDEQWEGIRSDPTITAWTAVLGDDPIPVGHAEIVEESESRIRFARLAIAPGLRGKHLGRQVMRELIEKARDLGYSIAFLYVHPDNTNAIRGYRSLGFEPVDEPVTIDGAVVSEGLRMELAIT
jgi:ribosomal protein S18 acetylase RimI-like enzyme